MSRYKSEVTGAWGSARVEDLKVLAALPDAAHLTSTEAALYINTTSDVLRAWRSQGRGPRFKGRGHFIRYVKSDLDEFMGGFDARGEAPPKKEGSSGD